ncbi:BMP family lipoprotein [Carnobacterium sp.]|uniref:BMP family lipoprotein n=1 Tax=Carnobacterium sp. TaxID=48221 RepID=UPI003C715ACE
MKKRNFMSLLALGLISGVTLAACGSDDSDTSTDSAESSTSKDDFSVVMVTDIGGVDDKSFNQSAWEGMKEWGEENGKEEGTEGFKYLQSNEDSEFVTNLNSAVQAKFDLVFGIGYKLKEAMTDVSGQNEDQQFVIIDDVIEAPNVASVLFKDHEAAFLAGVAAAETTETDKLGFIGGQESDVISRFEAGFVAGAKAVNPEIDINVEYVGSFGDAARGKQLAAAMYSSGIDVIYQAAGDSGNGVFSEAKDLMNADESKKLWVIGVDRDQEAEGKFDTGNLTLASTLKGVGTAVKDISNEAMAGEFAGGEVVNYGLAEGGVDLTDGNLTDEVKEKVAEYKEKIVNGEIEVPQKP